MSYDPSTVETHWYQRWEALGYFKADPNDARPPFCIVIPPPNVTGSLHMGHALDNTLQDILVRYKRMCGFATLWVPGTDHAGIATQNVVEKELAKENISRHQLGRKGFQERVWKWKAQSGGKIVHQLRRLGCSLDWSRERFTLDEGLSKAVRKVFVSLYEQNLIYRSTYLIHWCTRCLTALSDLEVEHEETQGNLTYFRYETTDGENITVATTRPETMLGDTAVAVHPDDARFGHLVGKTIRHPFLPREFNIVADSMVDPKFGTGAVKITPAHDPNDYALAERLHLPMITIFTEDGKLNSEMGSYAGLDRFEARKKIITDLKAKGLFEKTEPHRHAVGHCQRCQTVVEPRLSKQWFVKVAPLTQPAIEAVRNGKTQFVPTNWTKVYLDWMENLKDWCISRQLWWGHQIPVWYCTSCKKQTVTIEDPTSCQHCNSRQIEQDPDVLDTWFSSGLWPFSTLGWPENTADLKKFYPTSVLVTGFDIIFFWVARMMMMGLKFMNDVPFRTVHIHALVRDEKGQKMSKSKGNVIDPLLMMDKYGTDSFRFALASFAIQGRDIPVSEKRIEGYRNFINKLWNAHRLATSLWSDTTYIGAQVEPQSLQDRWIRTRLNLVITDVRRSIDEMKFNEAADTLFHFVWRELCDWYLEMSKPKAVEPKNLLYVFERTLKLLHPIIPFITEDLWQQLPWNQKKETIMLSAYPEVDGFRDDDALQEFSRLKEVVETIRTIRSENKISPGQALVVLLREGNSSSENIIGEILKHEKMVSKLANVKSITRATEKLPRYSALGLASGLEIWIPLEGLIDPASEKDRLEKEKGKSEKDVQFLEKRLSDESYRGHAPKELVLRDEEKLKEVRLKLERIEKTLTSF